MHTRVASTIVAVLLSISGSTVWAAGNVSGRSSSAPAIAVKPPVQHPRGALSVSGSGFPSNIDVTIRIAGQKLASVRTDSSGNFILTSKVPASTMPGKRPLSAFGGGMAAQTSLLVRTNWQMSNFGPQQRADNPYENVLSRSTVGRVAVAWQQTFDTSDGSAVYSSASVINGYVYTSVYYDVNVPGYLLKLDAATGAVLWSSKDGPAAGPPIIYNGNVYWEDGGDVIETSDATGQFIRNFPNVGGLAQEVLVGSTLYLGNAAVDLDTNQTIWSLSPATTREVSGFAYDNGMLFSALEDLHTGDVAMTALDAATGATAWNTTPTNTFIAQTPAVDNGEVIFSDDGGTTYALDETNGAQVWADAGVYGGSGSPPAVAGGTVDQAGPNATYALDETTGAVEWTNPVDTGGSPFGVVVANGVLYVAGGGLTAINTSTGATIFSDNTHADIGLAIVNGNIYSAQQRGLGFIDYAVSSS